MCNKKLLIKFKIRLNLLFSLNELGITEDWKDLTVHMECGKDETD